MNGTALKRHLYAFAFDVQPSHGHPDSTTRAAAMVRIKAFVFCPDPFEAQRLIAERLRDDHWEVLKMIEAMEIEESTIKESIDLTLLDIARHQGLALGVSALQPQAGDTPDQDGTTRNEVRTGNS
ncbi:hypothetical protein [Paraburkholderia antibiotica]|uniref:Uncharacterized protein n=1 Tax=Paraburkholderia antibiotica TaxID=2728839 RepID=A0A7X9X6G7_9BURK|nr:hypothetical protein [Paraburkholderia antibiotica]NML32321.1 hypothetical protein [Paraburkholderia antibiotica]